MSKQSLERSFSSKHLLWQLVDSPHLVETVRALPGPAFSALVRQIGLEDAGEVIALATTEQLVAAFDEDLFVNARPGQRESFDPERFATWLEVLLEAGDAVAARKVASLSIDFVVHALSQLVLVLDHDALQLQMGEGGRAAHAADKAIESSLSEEIDGYLLIARKPDGWDAVMALITALDQQHRAFLTTVLDRAAGLASPLIDNLAALTEVLSEEESLAEDVEAEREERRVRHGFVEPRAARSFLSLAKQPLGSPSADRDPVTRAFFRDRDRATSATSVHAAPLEQVAPATLLSLLTEHGVIQGPHRALGAAQSVGDDSVRGAEPTVAVDGSQPGPKIAVFFAALQRLQQEKSDSFHQRMEELAYLSNVLVAGASDRGERFRPAHAAEAALATVFFGACLLVNERTDARMQGSVSITPEALCQVLRTHGADWLFRKAASALVSKDARSPGFLRSAEAISL